MSKPQVMIKYSDDGGHTWSAEMWFDLVGDDKNYLTRVVLHGQGSAYNRVYSIKCSENISFTCVSARAVISFGF
ncbi:MAG: hypothetical protein V3V74_00385 [Nitrosomonadaceae bacterium]